MNEINLEFTNEPCVECSNLGHSTHTLQCEPVFITLNPDPYQDFYNEKLPGQQKKYIDKKIRECLIEINKKIKIFAFSAHYEFTKSQNLHVHAMMWINDMYAGLEVPLAYISKIFHRAIGRRNVRCSIAARTEWIKDMDRTLQYVNKSNIFEAVHSTIRTPITAWLTKGESLETQNNCDMPERDC